MKGHALLCKLMGSVECAGAQAWPLSAGRAGRKTTNKIRKFENTVPWEGSRLSQPHRNYHPGSHTYSQTKSTH